jgi:predicted nuclease of restriction endonuclease-like RecB superfamily
MLTADLVKPRLHHRRGELRVQWLDGTNGHWQRTAAELIALFRQQVGCPFSAWEEALACYEGDRIDYVVVRGLAKVLVDAATFVACEMPVLPAQVRAALFACGPAFAEPDLLHPRTRDELLAKAASELGLHPDQVETLLYADRHCSHILADAGPCWTPTDLIMRYNLELSRAALYWSDGLQVTIHDTYKDFWRYLKLFKLMFWATHSTSGGYRIDVDGPLSPFVSATTRYGRQLAAFLPALLLCQRWQMEATVCPPQFDQRLVYRLDNNAPLTTHFQRSGAFDSRLESDFAAEFEDKFGGKRGQWLLSREDEILVLGDTVMIPDFALTHKRDGRRALVEIVGFWHPEYLRRKVAKVRAAQRRDLILLVYEGVNLAKEKLQDIPGEVLYFQNRPVLKDVMAAVECAAV